MLFEVISIAFSQIFTSLGMALLLFGIVIGLTMGIIPGLGAMATIALILPFTYGWEKLDAFLLFSAIFGSTTVGGSVTAILLNTPGTPENIATTLDGYPMARKGKAAEAIATAAFSSMCGGLISLAVFIATIPLLRSISLMFGPPEIFWLGFFALVIISAVTKGSFLGSLIIGCFALILSFHGLNPITGTPRFVHGFIYLYDGFQLIPVLLGTFAVSEMIKLSLERESIAYEVVKVEGSIKKGIKNVLKNRYLFLRSLVIGYIIGAIPGIGGTVANYLAYAQAVQTSKNPETFGKGDPRGIVAPETANNAKDVGQLVPTLSLGIPGSGTMAVLLGAFILHGIQPGPFIIRDNLDVVAMIAVTLVFAFSLSCLFVMFLGQYLARLTTIDVYRIVPIVLVICFIAVYYIRYEILDIFVTLLFGMIGYILVRINVSRILLVLPIIIGPIIERNFILSLSICRGDYTYFFGPISIFLILIMVATIIYPFIKRKYKLKKMSWGD